MIYTNLKFDPTGWLEINYLQTIQLPDVLVPAMPALFDAEGIEAQSAEPERVEAGGTQTVTLQSTSYHPTQLDLIHADCEKHGVTIEGADATAIAIWVAAYVPLPPIALTTEERWSAIKDLRDDKTQNGGYQVNNHWFHSDTFSRTQQMGLVMMGANMPNNLSWKTLSGTFVAMTPVLAQQIFAAAANQDSALFKHAEILKANPYMDINSGWPETFNSGV